MSEAFGSSPRGRGTPQAGGAICQPTRFIPARAGNARLASVRRGFGAVHPRAGGERAMACGGGLAPVGSSPRGRGTRTEASRRPMRQRFIPARAGNAGPGVGLPDGSSVHPRAGGERIEIRSLRLLYLGSSPRGRGTPASTPSWSRYTRFIPARAGNAGWTRDTGSTGSVHPRAGGERWASLRSSHRTTGSSPRGRGTRLDVGSMRRPIRFIPARAGNAAASAP